ncbi:hypothetical protein PX52LOC_08229 [Limnoglobus roseus]|uniref:Uncharacterized protein n=2 Tax=Limnoglobus roseus TaxID=2598579 RepID=A0A5C1AQ29_9BACT|nr:hypothetical protein PX52LOC_08229 [Limnoglobus roseus]
MDFRNQKTRNRDEETRSDVADFNKQQANAGGRGEGQADQDEPDTPAEKSSDAKRHGNTSPTTAGVSGKPVINSSGIPEVVPAAGRANEADGEKVPSKKSRTR